MFGFTEKISFVRRNEIQHSCEFFTGRIFRDLCVIFRVGRQPKVAQPLRKAGSQKRLLLVAQRNAALIVDQRTKPLEFFSGDREIHL